MVVSPAATAAAALLPQGRLQVMAGAGHAPFLAAPDEIAAAIREFLLPVEPDAVVDANG